MTTRAVMNEATRLADHGSDATLGWVARSNLGPQSSPTLISTYPRRQSQDLRLWRGIPVAPDADPCAVSLYTLSVIRTFAHKGLEALFRTGSRAGVQPAHASRLRRQLAQLDVATGPQDMGLPGWGLHPLKGALAGHWSIWVSGNWRMTFRFEGTDAVLVDYRDYH